MTGEKIKDSLTLDDARRVIDAAMARAKEIGQPQDITLERSAPDYPRYRALRCVLRERVLIPRSCRHLRPYEGVRASVLRSCRQKGRIRRNGDTFGGFALSADSESPDGDNFGGRGSPAPAGAGLTGALQRPARGRPHRPASRRRRP